MRQRGNQACCRGHQVFFYKRAQIFVGDVWGAFKVRILPGDVLCFLHCNWYQQTMLSRRVKVSAIFETLTSSRCLRTTEYLLFSHSLAFSA